MVSSPLPPSSASAPSCPVTASGAAAAAGAGLLRMAAVTVEGETLSRVVTKVPHGSAEPWPSLSK